MWPQCGPAVPSLEGVRAASPRRILRLDRPALFSTDRCCPLGTVRDRCYGHGGQSRCEGASGPMRADAHRRRSDTADQAAARHAYPVAMAPATGAKSPATGTIVWPLPATIVASLP